MDIVDILWTYIWGVMMLAWFCRFKYLWKWYIVYIIDVIYLFFPGFISMPQFSRMHPVI